MATTVSSKIIWLLGSFILILLSGFMTNIFAKKKCVPEDLCKERRESCVNLMDERHKALEKKIDYLIITVDKINVRKD